MIFSFKFCVIQQVTNVLPTKTTCSIFRLYLFFSAKRYQKLGRGIKRKRKIGLNKGVGQGNGKCGISFISSLCVGGDSNCNFSSTILTFHAFSCPASSCSPSARNHTYTRVRAHTPLATIFFQHKDRKNTSNLTHTRKKKIHFSFACDFQE